MKKVLFTAIIVGVLATSLFSIGKVEAAGVCTALSQNLAFGLSDGGNGQVTLLQQFLMSQNYLSTTISTGYFGGATLKAVKEYQFDHDLPSTGYVGALTRAAIQSQSCGTGYINPNYPTYNNNYYGAVSITSLSTNTAAVGSSVTIYGTGFDTTPTNIVNVGGMSVSGLSSNGTTLTFTVPQLGVYNTYNQNCSLYYYGCTNNNQVGTYQITVSNSRGTSNAISFTVNSNYTNNYNNNYNNNYYGAVTITSLSPTSGATGGSLTIYGSGFSSYGNTVYFGSQALTNISSYNGSTITVTIPNCQSYCTTNYYNGQYGTLNVYVVNAQGQTSNSQTFTLNSYNNGNGYGAPTISNVNGPTTLSVGTQGVWSFQVNNPNYNSYVTTSVRWGDENTYSNYNSGQTSQSTYIQTQQTVSFTHTYQTAGSYTVVFTVTDTSGRQNTASVTVVVGGYTNGNNQISLSYLSPNQGRIGTQIMLQGSGFTSYGNIIHFGNGGMINAYSSNGSVIYFTVPTILTPCDVQTVGTYCPLYAQQVTPGSYPVYVVNAQGQTTNTLNFTVTY